VWSQRISRALDKTEVHMEKLLLTPEEAARALSIGRSKLYQLLASGSLRSVTIGSSRRVPVEALRNFVAEIDAGLEAGSLTVGSLPSGGSDGSSQPTPLVDGAAVHTGRRSA
jgi:excisionase family DNA binding protein